MSEWIRTYTGEGGFERKYVELEDAGMSCFCGAKILAYDAFSGYFGNNQSFFCNPDDFSIGHKPISA